MKVAIIKNKDFNSIIEVAKDVKSVFRYLIEHKLITEDTIYSFSDEDEVKYDSTLKEISESFSHNDAIVNLEIITKK